jgi:hypothetical protein
MLKDEWMEHASNVAWYGCVFRHFGVGKRDTMESFC